MSHWLVTPAARDAGTMLAGANTGVKRSHLGEILATMLGYGTYAALLAEEKTAKLGLMDSEALVFNLLEGQRRAQNLGYTHLAAISTACCFGLENHADRKCYRGVEKFLDRPLPGGTPDLWQSTDRWQVGRHIYLKAGRAGLILP